MLERRLIRVPGLALFIVGLVLAAWSTRDLEQRNADILRAEFTGRVERNLDALQRRLQQYEKGVRGARGVIAVVGVDRLDLPLFQRYSASRSYATEFPGARGFGFVRRVPRSDEARFLQRLQRESRSRRAIRVLTPHDDDRWVIEYVEPEADNLSAIGLDIASEANRRQGLEQAVASGEATLTHPVTLVQADGKINQGFLLLLPVYRDGGFDTGDASKVPVAERPARAVALAYAPLVIEEVLADFTLAGDELTISLDDLQDGRATRFYSTHGSDVAKNPLLNASRNLAIFGREWHVELAAAPGFAESLALPDPRLRGLLLAFIGLLVAMLVDAWLVVRQRRYDHLRGQLAEQREHQAEIQALNAGLEQRIAERTADLERSLSEVQTLSYALSHDLTTPLRAIEGFSRILLNEKAAALDATGRDYLQRIRASAQRMGFLIDDLLTLSRLSSQALQRRPIDLSALAATVVAQLRKAEPARQVEVSIEAGLQEEADPYLLGIVLEKLLANAWKYTVDTTPARIGLSCETRDGERIYVVHDNGTGFDMAHSDKLFNPFQRLHRPEQFTGRGIGLAIAKRIVQRHGGRIWADSAIGSGTRFFFTLAPAGTSSSSTRTLP